MAEGILCRKAVPGDEDAVFALAKSLEMHPGGTDEARTHGFLIAAKSVETYRSRFAVSRYSLVAESGGQVVGFMIAHDAAELAALGSDLRYFQSLKDYLAGLRLPHWVYIDEIGVHSAWQHHGVGHAMHAFLRELAPRSALVAGITHAPVPNESSRAFFTGCGHALHAEVQEGDWRCGMYVRASDES